jgi:hypothetical protein
MLIPFHIALHCVIRKVQENHVGLKLNGTHLSYVWSMLMMIIYWTKTLMP